MSNFQRVCNIDKGKHRRAHNKEQINVNRATFSSEISQTALLFCAAVTAADVYIHTLVESRSHSENENLIRACHCSDCNGKKAASAFR